MFIILLKFSYRGIRPCAADVAVKILIIPALDRKFETEPKSLTRLSTERHCEKTGFLSMSKQWRRSASQ